MEKINTKKCCCPCYIIILFIPLTMVIFNDFLLPIILGYKEDYYDYDDEKYEKEDSTFSLIIGVFLSCFISVFTCAYTLIIIYSTTRRQYITADFLYDKSINDDLSLIKQYS